MSQECAFDDRFIFLYKKKIKKTLPFLEYLAELLLADVPF
jgi:hypothetical protein